MDFKRIAAVVTAAAVLALAPGVGRAAKPIPKKQPKGGAEVGKTGADQACMGWILKYLRTGDKDMLVDDAKVRLLWHEPETKPEKFLKKKLGKFDGEVYWDAVSSMPGEVLGCSVLMGMDREIGKQGWIIGVDLYARYDLVKEGGGLKASRVTVVLEYEQNEKTGAIFERPLDACNVGTGIGLVPEQLCSVASIYDTPKGGPDSEIWTTRDITEVLVFSKSGHLSSYSVLGYLEQTDDGVAPLGLVDVDEIELGLGKKVLSVREEKVKHVGGKGDCAAYMITTTLSYHTLVKGQLAEIFSAVVDVFPDAPCASDAQLDKMTDIVVNVDPVCKGDGPCDLRLEHDQATPVQKYWSEIWKYDGKTYKKVKTLKDPAR